MTKTTTLLAKKEVSVEANRTAEQSLPLSISVPYLLFIGDAAEAKTARGLLHWCPDHCLGQLRLGEMPTDLGLPDMSLDEAISAGAKTLIIGVTPIGGQIPAHWVPVFSRALEKGLDIANGMHARLADFPDLCQLAENHGREIHDVRHPDQQFTIPDFSFRPGKRLLTVGTDCAVGKMFTALAIEREFKSRGLNADFRATGQTGILIAGSGVSVDAVPADFISSAAAWLSPANAPEHWDIIEGQGSLFHPAYAGVTLGLVHGSQPDVMVLCTDPSRETMMYFDGYPQPSLTDCIDAYIWAARRTNPKAHVAGISINTAGMKQQEALRLIDKTQQECNLICFDPLRTGVGGLVDILQQEK